MNSVVVVGSQWGDEGKGKITDFLALDADVVVRSQGGNNAGHTISFNGKKFALQTIPSGIFNPKIKNVMTNGMVINPKAMLDELNGLKQRGITDYQLYVSNRAHIVLPYHILLDGAYESLKGDSKIGTTKKGIGPAYTDKASRIGIRMADFINPSAFHKALSQTLPIKNLELKSLGIEPLNLEDIIKEYTPYAEEIKPYVCDTSILLEEELDKNSKVLFEGAQGVMLCLDHGTYPYVTSSSPTAASVPLNCGIAPKYIQNVLGVSKAYNTRVGEGPFPTEINDDLATYIRERGHEYGTVTKRPRRVGFFDSVVINHARRVSGINYLSLMLFDVLSGIKTLKICKAYRLDGKEINYIPASLEEFCRCEPIYEELPGWEEDITKVKSFDDLPKNAQAYLRRIEELTKTKVAMFSVGPDRLQTVVLHPLFNK